MTLFKIYDVKVKINYFLIPILIMSYFADYLLQLLTVLLIVLMHEGAHCIVSYLHDVKISEIQLFPFGGVVKAEEELGVEPLKEVMIAIAGPLFNFALFFFLLVFKSVFTYDNSHLEFIMHSTLVIGGFNLLPVIPLDGGRVVRALLTHWLGLKKATMAAIQIGKIICIIFFLLGVWMTLKDYQYLYIVLLSVFLFYSILQEKKMAYFLLIKEILRKKRTLQSRGVMNTKYLTVLESVDIKYLLQEFSYGKYHFVTVVSQSGRVVGTVSESEILDAMSLYGSKITLGRLVKIIKFKEKQ